MEVINGTDEPTVQIKTEVDLLDNSYREIVIKQEPEDEKVCIDFIFKIWSQLDLDATDGYCSITYFRACLIFAYFALWPMREFKTARKVSLTN